MRIGSLFSGIGGLELGLERAGLGETVWQVECDEYCQAVLAKHWPNAERFDDVRTVGAATLSPVDLICGGFPCQDISSAGKRAGLAGARSGLWFEYLRIVSELRPPWVVVENVASGAHKWVDVVREGLEQQGYACLPEPITAAAVGAPHKRARIFIVAANAHADWKPACPIDAKVAGSSQLTANTNSSDLRNEPRGAGRSRREGPTFPANNSWSTPQPDMVRSLHGFSTRFHGAGNAALRKQRALPSRRIKALGNAVVPQCAEVVGHIIAELCR